MFHRLIGAMRRFPRMAGPVRFRRCGDGGLTGDRSAGFGKRVGEAAVVA
jgi:hypothetical protein